MSFAETASPARSAAALALVSLVAAALPGPTRAHAAGDSVPVLMLEQVTRGLPSRTGNPERSEKTRTAHQVLWVDPAGRRLRLEQFRETSDRVAETVYILRADPDGDGSIVWTFPGGHNQYREYRGDLNENQRNRRIHELEQLRIIESYPPRERKKAMEELHLRPGGKRAVTTEWSEAPDRLGHPCRRLQVTENGRVVIDADIARVDVPGDAKETGGSSYFELYRRLGVFSEEVLEKLRDVRGIPLRASIAVVTELPTYTLETEITRLERVEIDPARFELPPGAEKVEDAPPITRCIVCGKEDETKRMGRVFTEKGFVYVCSQRCQKKLEAEVEQRGKRRKPPR